MEFEQRIQPGVGLGPLLLGSTQAAVVALLGDPASSTSNDYGDGVEVLEWEFDQLGLSLSFSADDGGRLGGIMTWSGSATLHGARLVGMSEDDLLQGEFGGLGPPMFDEDFDETGRDYTWEAVNLWCWVTDGVVATVSIQPLYDAAGEVPQWPAGTA